MFIMFVYSLSKHFSAMFQVLCQALRIKKQCRTPVLWERRQIGNTVTIVCWDVCVGSSLYPRFRLKSADGLYWNSSLLVFHVHWDKDHVFYFFCVLFKSRGSIWCQYYALNMYFLSKLQGACAKFNFIGIFIGLFWKARVGILGQVVVWSTVMAVGRLSGFLLRWQTYPHDVAARNSVFLYLFLWAFSFCWTAGHISL